MTVPVLLAAHAVHANTSNPHVRSRAHTRAVDNEHEAEDFSRYGTITLFKEVHSLMAAGHEIQYRLLCVLRALDTRQSIDGRPFSLPGWLARTFGLGFGAAREKVRTARALGHLPLIDAAFREGRLSYAKVRALTRVARKDDEAKLLGIALDSSADALEKIVQRYRQRERLDDVQELIRQRSLTYRWAADGSLQVSARLTPEQGAIWLKALEKAETALASTEEFQCRQADALTHALEESLVERPSAAGGAGSADNADKVGSAGNTGDASDVSSRGGRSRVADHYQVVVHVSAETLAGGPPTAGALYTPAIENGPALHPETIRRLACDGALVSVLRGAQGEVLNVGRRTRVIPRAIRRALKARDGHCRYPGCGQTRFLSGHHIVHWARGGATCLDNLVLLCPRHHRYVHEYGLSVTRNSKGFAFAVT